jgi:hypothetical protein
MNNMSNDFETDVLIVGGGLGGVAAALAVSRLGRRTILVEEQPWLGGQLSSQGVPPDESPWIDSHGYGGTASYRRLRDTIRAYYRSHYPLTESALHDKHLNPGAGNVSPLCHEPRAAVAAIDALLAPYRSSGILSIWHGWEASAAECTGDKVNSVSFCRGSETRSVCARYVLDATELGDLLELAGVEHVTGAESQAETGEPHARADRPDPLDQQAISWAFALDYHPKTDNTIDRPEQYEFWREYRTDFWPDKLLSWTTPEPVSLEPVHRPIFSGPMESLNGNDLWHFRRILYTGHHRAGAFDSDIVVVNWPQIDYWLGPLTGVTPEEKKRHLKGARQLSLSMLYWMQTEAPRLDGGTGYRELRLRGDVMGTDDLAQAVYVRESRRIKAEFTVLEQHVGVEARRSLRGAEQFTDSVGIGSYRIDLHPSTAGRNYIDINDYPHQIPLGSLIPVRVENLLPANKNLGVTHVTNGCYRLHPIEWNIGEAAGALAAHCLNTTMTPREVYRNEKKLRDFQTLLAEKLGFQLEWPEELRIIPRDKNDPLGI